MLKIATVLNGFSIWFCSCFFSDCRRRKLSRFPPLSLLLLLLLEPWKSPEFTYSYLRTYRTYVVQCAHTYVEKSSFRIFSQLELLDKVFFKKDPKILVKLFLYVLVSIPSTTLFNPINIKNMTLWKKYLKV